MSSLVDFRQYKRMDSWADPEDSGRMYYRNTQVVRTICLPGEYDAYLKRFGHVYRIERSNTGFCWVLTYDDGTLGWDQKGYYVKTLVSPRNGGWEEALKRAQALLPSQAAFWIEDQFTMGRLPGDELFEEFLKSIGVKL
jgi:hypothetical protein